MNSHKNPQSSRNCFEELYKEDARLERGAKAIFTTVRHSSTRIILNSHVDSIRLNFNSPPPPAGFEFQLISNVGKSPVVQGHRVKTTRNRRLPRFSLFSERKIFLPFADSIVALHLGNRCLQQAFRQ